MRRLLLILLLIWLPISAYADCENSTQVNANGATTIAAAVSGRTIFICAYQFTAAIAGVGVRFSSGSTNLTGPMVIPQWGNLTSPGDGAVPILQGLPGQSVVVTAGTSEAMGFVTWTQR